MTPVGNVTSVSPVRFVAALTFITGLWLFVSPWVWDAFYEANSWNSYGIGIAVACMAAIAFAADKRFLGFRWLIAALGAWTFASPWVYSYIHNTGRFSNSLAVGVVLFVLAIID